MIKVLLVMTDPLRRGVVSVLATAQGLLVTESDSGIHALTQLEGTVPDLIVCDDRLPDLSLQEFYEIIRSEPGTRQTPLLLMTDTAPTWLSAESAVCVTPTCTSRELVSLLKSTSTVAHAPFQLSELGPSPLNPHLQGQLEIVSLSDLMVSLNQLVKTGQLVLRMGEHEALIYLLGGEVWHVEYERQNGEPALLSTFSASGGGAVAAFAYTTLPSEWVGRLPRTVERPTSRLLLEIAVDLDHL